MTKNIAALLQEEDFCRLLNGEKGRGGGKEFML